MTVEVGRYVGRGLVVAALLGVFSVAGARAQPAVAERKPDVRVVKFDVSPPLRALTPAKFWDVGYGVLLPDPGLVPEQRAGTFADDPVVQDWANWIAIPSPTVSFDGPPNLSGVAPPDPVGDIGPDHYVAMSNLSFEIYDRTGTSVYGPVPNNTLWAGFGGDCETDNSGDPIVLYDQLADRWLLTQFTASGPSFFNCVALSVTGDPTGTYYRWAVNTGSNFPDYPKYGVWPDAYYIATREFPSSGADRPGAYAMDRAAMLGGDPNPTIIAFVVTPGSTPTYTYGDGLLPSDLDGTTLPPAGSPNYYIGTADDGHPDGAPEDLMNIWEFHADFATPDNSTFELTTSVAVAPYDSIFPCGGSRSCIPQPETVNRLDILSYRQRPLHRAAYRNFGTHESIVTNQSVEAAAGIAGVRWYELRDPGGTPQIYQQGTYAPGTTDGVHRWMGSIAQDGAGNIGLGYSASSGDVFPSVWYTGRLVTDALGTLPQGEGSIVDGTGSQTGGGSRWGDYTSMNVDPVDDCTFWYVNEWLPRTSGRGWQLRIGAFRFNECGPPDFVMTPTPTSQTVCQPAQADYLVDITALGGLTDPVTLSASGEPAGTTVGFSTNPVNPPGASTMTIDNTGGATPGSSTITITGTAPGPITHMVDVGLKIVNPALDAPVLSSPADGARGVWTTTTLAWSAVAGADGYLVEVDDDPGFGSPAFSATVTGTTVEVVGLLDDTTYNWRVTASNVCASGPTSAVFTFTTRFVFCSSPGLAIPDDEASGATDSLVVPAGVQDVTDLELSIAATHTRVGDLAFTLRHDAGTPTTGFDRPGVPGSPSGCAGDDIDVILDDEAGATVENECGPGTPTIAGTFVPNVALSAYDGQSISGTWTLQAVDAAPGDTGTLAKWCLGARLVVPIMFSDGFESGDLSAWSSAVP